MRRLCSIVDILGGEVLPDAPGVHKIVLGGKIEKDAQKMRDYLGASASEPIRNLIQLLENRGILVYSCDIDNDAFSGMNGKHIEDEEYEDCIQKLVDKNGGKVRLPKHELEIRLQRARRKGRDTMQYNNTLCYYNSHADKFYETTVNVAFTTMYKPFLSKLKEVKENPSILDFGCGSGRDTKYFLEHGYQVEAMDGSIELCRLASRYTGIDVKNMLFRELSEVKKYDGIWACSSILHLPQDELSDVMRKMAAALKENGVLYTSSKYGFFAGERNGRYFTDMTEELFTDFISGIKGLEVVEQWTTSDARPEREREKWLNIIMKKV